MFWDVAPIPAERTEAPTVHWTVGDLLWGLFAIVVALVAVIGALIALGRTAGIGADEAGVPGVLATITFEALFGGAVLLLAWRRGMHWADLGLVRPVRWGPAMGAWIGAYAVMLTWGLLLAIATAAGADTARLPGSNTIPFGVDRSPLLLGLLAVAVVFVAPLCEELYFRGLWYRGLRAHWRVLPAIFGSAFLFAAFHLNLSVVLPFMAIGALFAWTNEQSGSLWTSIAAHVGFNAVSYVLTLAGVGK